MAMATGIARDAIASGDLELPEGIEPEVLTFGLWSMSFGTYAIMAAEGDMLPHLGVKNPHAAQAQEHRPPDDLVADILNKGQRIMEIMREIKEALRTGVN